MIVVETSALVAIYRRESDMTVYQLALSAGGTLRLPATAYVEVCTLRGYGEPRAWLDGVIARYGLVITAIDSAVAALAADAYQRYGRGSGSRANLNFGDCLSYAVARHLGAPLLYKGDDFIHTDIESALAS
jgi:ribonuclease VapC